MKCPVCSKPMPQTNWYLRLLVTCSPACGHIRRVTSYRARGASVDTAAVFRLLDGSRVTSTRAERIEAVRVLSSQGRSAAWIADHLRITSRTVVRYRHELQNRKAA